MTINGNTKEWSNGYLVVTKNRLLQGAREYYQRKALLDFLPHKDMKILDVGCGSGNFIKYLEQNGYSNVYGVEPSEELLNEIKENDKSLYTQVRKGLSTKLPFGNNFFDCIYFFNVLHHLKNVNEYSLTTREVDRCLRSDGVIVLLEPRNEWIYSTKRFIAKLLSPVSKLFANIYQMMMEEKEPVTCFFRHHGAIKEELTRLNYKILRDRKMLYQWILVMQKAKD